MNYIFVLVCDRLEWEDIVIYIDEVEAKIQSVNNPNSRVEIFSKTENGYKPTYCYYKNGKLIET